MRHAETQKESGRDTPREWERENRERVREREQRESERENRERHAYRNTERQLERHTPRERERERSERDTHIQKHRKRVRETHRECKIENRENRAPQISSPSARWGSDRSYLLLVHFLSPDPFFSACRLSLQLKLFSQNSANQMFLLLFSSVRLMK